MRTMTQTRNLLIDLLESIQAHDFAAAESALEDLENAIGGGAKLPAEPLHKALDEIRFAD